MDDIYMSGRDRMCHVDLFLQTWRAYVGVTLL